MTTLEELAAAKTLLVVSDFDGTLAGFSDDPANVAVNQFSVSALEKLAELPNTVVAILSGRHLAGLAQVAKVSDNIILAGSHGAESTTTSAQLSDEKQRQLEELNAQLEHLLKGYPGARLERKPMHSVVHTRQLINATQTQEVFSRARQLCPAGFHTMDGKQILEFSALKVTKGTWISATREFVGADAVLFLGDDQTDERGFAALGAGDIGVKVGAGETLASTRLSALDDVPALLESLYQLRAAR